ncbi:MAG: decarboxylating NADP(+)-dependent phosphogluconate dehydrogenase [Actinomycetia bacterium]|nr:decarboxylating NADP(+)-dependent phosphogluconate dehydrogenase [Actinomycetes bacterium]
MGQNLVLNLLDHDRTVAVFNRTTSRTHDFVSGEASGRRVIPADDIATFVTSIARPRTILMMIKAGAPVDAQIDVLLPLLDEGDVVIDGGNSLFTDTERRFERLQASGIHYVGAGISGGEEGARYGPSIMPGGDERAWPIIEDMITAIAASVGDEPMAAWIGPGGSGHYVKMVHNGIEYGDMQVIAEAYDIMTRGLGLAPEAMARHFHNWNEGKLDSYLIEITANILAHGEPDGQPTIDRILDAAGQKGTGKWTVIASMEEGMPVSLVGESVYARMVSALVDERAVAASRFDEAVDRTPFEEEDVVTDLHDALYASKIVSYTQGFMLINAASRDHGWGLDKGTIAGLWRAGCIIRSRFLGKITAAYRSHPELENLLLDEFFAGEIERAVPGWRRTVARAVTAGIPVPAYSSALAFYDAYRSRRLPANLIQAQRDYFGAHTYERTDRARGVWFHTDWTGQGGDVTSGTYDV